MEYPVTKPTYKDETPPAGPPQASDKRRSASRSLSGVSSLQIPLERRGNELTFTSLGTATELEITLIERRRSLALAWAIAAGLFAWGVARRHRPVGQKVRYVFVVALLATLLPIFGAIGGYSLVLLANPAFYAAMLLVVFYLVLGAIRWAIGKWASFAEHRAVGPTPSAESSLPSSASALLLVGLTLSLLATPAIAADRPAAAAGDEAALAPLAIPDDAVLRLYQPSNRLEVPKVEQVLVPYAIYQSLWNRAYPEKQLDTPRLPAAYALAGAHYESRLADDDNLLVRGVLEFDVYERGFVEIPLPLEGGVLTRALLDGSPARLKVVVAQEPNEPMKPGVPNTTAPNAPGTQAAAQQSAAPQVAMPVLVVEGKGRHRLELEARLTIERRGGWRLVRSRLPTSAHSKLQLSVPQANTEVRLPLVRDRRIYDATAADEVIATTLAEYGRLSLEWRPRVAAGQIDVALAAHSQALLSVQEDGLRMAWQVRLDFRGAQHDRFQLRVPADYLIERVTGDNLHGWEIRPEENAPGDNAPGDNQPNDSVPAWQRLDVTLLAPAIDSEQLTVYLSQRRRIGEQANELLVPLVMVSDAALHSGDITLQRSAVIELTTTESRGIVRADLRNDSSLTQASVEAGDASPLGLRTFQRWQFSTTPFTLRLAARMLQPQITAEFQSIWRIGQRERTLETSVQLKVEQRPLHRVHLALPDGFKVAQVTAADDIEWIVRQEAERQVLDVGFLRGQLGLVPLVIQGSVGEMAEASEFELPRFEVLEAQRQQGTIVVQTDPSFDSRVSGLTGIEQVPLAQTFGWLANHQHALARLALQYTEPSYTGSVKLVARQPQVRGYTITNVRVTDRAIEETILLDLMIRDAGIREVRFLLPASLAKARIQVPLLREKRITPVDPAVANSPVRVSLQLQEEVMGSLRVFIENDRLPSGDVETAPLAELETGRTDGTFVALETLGREEVVVEQAVGFEPLGRQQEDWQRVAALLRSPSTQAFRLRSGAASRLLTYSLRDRLTVETAGARISLAETQLVFDATGAYRASQTYHVFNSTEQFLVVEMPLGSRLWTAWVDRRPVKPLLVAGEAQALRIPLVKTDVGDISYEVVLTYGGQQEALGALRKVRFPFLRVKNIGIERSLAELYVPPEYRWIDFGGTMRLVEDAADLEAGRLAQFNSNLKQLNDTLSSSDPYAKLRASKNLERLEQQAASFQQRNVTVQQNKLLQQELLTNSALLSTAREQQLKSQAFIASSPDRNRQLMCDYFETQDNKLSKDAVNTLLGNWRSIDGKLAVDGDKLLHASQPGGENRAGETTSLARGAPGQAGFDTRWFVGNSLVATVPEPEDSIPVVYPDPQAWNELTERQSKIVNRQQTLSGEAGGKQPMPQSRVQLAPPQSAVRAQSNGVPGSTPQQYGYNDYELPQPVLSKAGEAQYGQGQSDAEEMSRRREKESSSMDSVGGGFGGTLSKDLDAVSRYRDRLELDGQHRQAPGSDTPGMMGGGFGGSRGRYEFERAMASDGQSAVGGQRESREVVEIISDEMPDGMEEDNLTDFLPPMLATFGGAGAAPTGYASLAIEIPRQGTVYRFDTVRGDMEVVATVASGQLVDSLVRLAILVGVALLGLLLVRSNICGRLLAWLNWQRMSILLMVLGLLLLLGQAVALGMVLGFIGLLWWLIAQMVHRHQHTGN